MSIHPNILIIAHFCGEFDGKDNNRFNYLAYLLAANGYIVELVTSDFSHTKKAKRNKSFSEGLSYTVTYITEPAYAKNVSLNRFYSHYIFGLNLRRYLRNRIRPDLIYCATPSLDAAGAAAQYCQTHNIDIPFIIDVQDLWPEAFRMVTNMTLAEPIFNLIGRSADRIYSAADEIVTVSESYAARAHRVNKKCVKAHSVYLGTDLASFDEFAIQNSPVKPEKEIWLAYAGTLGHSYDLTTVIDALAIVKGRGASNIKFIVMGDGPLRSKFEAHAIAKGINAAFTGRLSYGKLAGMLKASDIAVNPISRGAAQSIINKHADYAAAGLPVLNTQESPEYAKLVDKFQMGFNCNNNDSDDLAEKLLTLCADAKLRAEMSQNSRKLAEERFDRKHTYEEIVELVRETVNSR